MKSWNESLERWKDGTIRYINRDSKGHFIKSDNPKFYNNQKVGIWNKEPQQKIVPEITEEMHKGFVKGNYYRASISLNVPLNGRSGKPNYKNFTFVKIDLKENIDMHKMYDILIEEMENKLHYKNVDFWFECGFGDCDKQFPKPYSANSPSETFEGTDY